MTEIDSTLVSVIIPCYNYAHFLGEAIESVLRQSYKNFEIIVVDDASTDGTAEVAARYSRVRYVRQPNQGPCAARNNGARLSRGGFLVFLDADDMLMRNALDDGVRKLKANPECAFVSGSCQFIDNHGSAVRTGQSWQFVEKEHYHALLRMNYIWNPANVMHRRNAFEAVGGFNPALATNEDYELYLRIARQYPVCCQARIVAKYRKHNASLSFNPEKMLKYSLMALRMQSQYVEGNERYEKQWERGLRLYQEYYGRRVVRRAYNSLFGRRDFRRLTDSVLALADCYREGLLMILLLIARRAGWFKASRFKAGWSKVGDARRNRDSAKPPALADSQSP